MVTDISATAGTRVFGRLPLSNIVPFTYRDGLTFADLLYEIRNHVQTTFPNSMQEILNEVINAVNVDLSEMGEQIITNANEMQSAYANFIQQIESRHTALVKEIDRRVMSINNRVGPESIQRKTLKSNSVLTVDSVWPDAHPITFAYTQDSTGYKTVTPGEKISGNLEINPTPNSTTVFDLMPDGLGNWSIIQRRSNGVIVEDYYSFFDLGDWAPAIRRAVQVAQFDSSPVVFRGGKTYLIKSSLVFNGIDICFISDGASNAIIKIASQIFDPIVIGTPTNTFTKFLVANQQFGTNDWILNDATGIEPGMIAVVKSSAPWYYDPRTTSTDARKSELHRVVAVNGTHVEFEDQANDGYNITTEQVEIAFFKPINVRMTNITVKGFIAPYAANAPEKTGIILTGAYDPIFDNVNVEDMSVAGFSIRLSYRPKVKWGHTHNANAVSTGYGVSFQGCAWPQVFGRSFHGCRRGVDFSGANIITRNGIVDSCNNYGGGRQSDGKYYGWGPNNTLGIQNYGFGSHGAADHTTYRNCKTANLHIPYSLRGGDEIIENCDHMGRTRGGFISLISGGGLTVQGCTLRTETGTGAKNTSIYDGGGNVNTRRPDAFIKVNADYDTSAASKMMISNIDAEVQDRFIEFADGKLPNWFYITELRVGFATSASDAECAVMWNLGALNETGFSRWYVGPMFYRRETGTSTPAITKNINLQSVRRVDVGFSAATS